MDGFERKFRQIHGQELTQKILLHTSQMFDYPFWMREQTACMDNPEIAYELALYDDAGKDRLSAHNH